MMPEQQDPHYNDLRAAMRGVMHAHAAVAQEIATHAEKHRAAQHEARLKMEAEEKLIRGIPHHAA